MTNDQKQDQKYSLWSCLRNTVICEDAKDSLWLVFFNFKIISSVYATDTSILKEIKGDVKNQP